MNQWAFIAYVRLLLVGLFFLPLGSALLGSAQRLQAQPNLSGLGSIQADTIGLAAMQEGLEVLGIIPWQWAGRTNWGANEVSTDSLLRWEHYTDGHAFWARRADGIAYEMGTVGRQSGHYVQGYGPGDQVVYLEGIDLSNPITGLPELQYVPIYKVSSIQEQPTHRLRSDWRIRDYYLVKPISTLNYDESSFTFRNLEFGVGHNFSERSHLELSFWDRRAGGNYPANEIKGSQVFAKGYYHLNNTLRLDVWAANNSFEADESFGYSNSPETFPFSEYGPSSRRNSVSSNSSRSDWYIRLGHRPDSSSIAQSSLQIGRSTHEFSLPFGTDTTAWNIRSFWLAGATTLERTNWGLSAEGRFSSYTNRAGSDAGFHSIDQSSWWETNTNLQGYWQVIPTAHLRMGVEQVLTGDRGAALSAWMGIDIKRKMVKANLRLGQGSQVRSIQEEYWTSNSWRVDEFDVGLNNSKNSFQHSQFISASVDLWPEGFLSVWGNARYSIESGTAILAPAEVAADGMRIYYAKEHNFWVTSIGFDAHSLRWEYGMSATAFSRGNGQIQSQSADFFETDMQFRVRSHAFWKGYVFERAAYTKMGIRLYGSPFTSRSLAFDTAAQWWSVQQDGLAEQAAFLRTDLEISSRVRSMMVFLRWENVGQGVLGPGYFGADSFPMPGRRLVVSIKATFRN